MQFLPVCQMESLAGEAEGPIRGCDEPTSGPPVRAQFGLRDMKSNVSEVHRLEPDHNSDGRFGALLDLLAGGIITHKQTPIRKRHGKARGRRLVPSHQRERTLTDDKIR